ncbi:SusC/RagA family TonB-linked outer membrane protein [Haoranjiania flava]|uniref:SusC/RagA family TonB-linked outer membrane protein n=1 Tax=Haoranjiania flava TaxID=1856322 RepID=A0AAE3IPJ2_9BACT|nr:SusC/RagA family TonB-linked outer membrane protein [Haoranjiania flava]MCU7694776.1 SusC/RagA family TonB-linked outer membrane protein [Haoranjiania flava]
MKQFFKLKLLLLLAMLCLGYFTDAQIQRVVGTVTGEGQKPLEGAAVQIVGKPTTGTLTDDFGKYAINAEKGDVLNVSFTGYESQRVTVGDNTTINISLVLSDNAMDEIVVVGYGTMRRSQITGSVSKLDERVLETGVRANPASALAGTIPGLRVQQTSGRPGAMPSVVLRGGTNYDGSGSPLVVVDGIIRGSMSDINQNDIESIEVLKDASATAIYGARANNGVILITTKQGRTGRSEIEIKYQRGINTINNPYDFLNAEDYIYWSRKAIQVSGIYEPGRLSQLTAASPFGTGNLFYNPTNNTYYDGNQTASAVWSTMKLDQYNRKKLADGWKTMIDPVYGDTLIYNFFDYKKAALRDHANTNDVNVSAMGGNDKGKYYAGVGYYHELGLPINTYYKRLSFVLNGEYKIKPWLTTNSNLNFVTANWRDPVTNTEGRYMARSLGAPPTMRGLNEKGELLVGRDYQDGNPQVTDSAFIRRNNTDKFTMVQGIRVDFLKELYLKANATYYYDLGYYESFDRDYLRSPGSYYRSRRSSASTDKAVSQLYNAYLNYTSTLGSKHNVNAMAGTEYYNIYSQGFSAAGEGAPTDDFMDLVLTIKDAAPFRDIDSYHSRERILSFFGRLNYDYDNRYLMTFTLRRDGYSKLLNNRWGTFPGISLGWNVHREKFFENLAGTINQLKLKGSYGQNGNVSGIGRYSLQGSYGTNKYNSNIGYLLTGLPFPNLLWERSSTFEFGFDATFIRKIDLSTVYYNRITTDKISSLTLPATSGFTSLTTNNGSLQNQGVEFNINYRALQNQDWRVTVNLNGAYNYNKILKLPYNGLPNNRQGGFQVYDPSSGKIIWVGGFQEGQNPSVAYAFVAENLYRTQADLDKHAKRVDLEGYRKLVSPAIYNTLTQAEKDKTYFPIALGDIMWKDLDNNDTIDFRDRQYIGSTIPRWTGGFSVFASYKAFSLSARMDYALGFWAYDGPRAWFMGNMQGSFNTISEVFDTYTPENVNAKYPTYYWADQLYKRNVDRPSSMFYSRGDYLSFREISLMYSLPLKYAERIKSQGVQISLTGQNLGYLSKSTLFSPESGSIGTGGAGEAGYPLPRIFVLSFQFKF